MLKVVYSPPKNIEKDTKRDNSPQIMEKNMLNKEENNAIKQEMDQAIKKLESMGIDPNAHKKDIVGLGDVVEAALQSVGITEERFKAWFNLKECNCSKRKAYLNNLFSWKKSQG